MKNLLRLKLVKSTNKKLKAHKACVRGLGLRKIGSEVIVEATLENRGMIDKVAYLLEITEVK